MDEETAGFRFDVPLLARRVDSARRWCTAQPGLRALPLGYFGASTRAGAALCAAAGAADVRAIVSRGGCCKIAIVPNATRLFEEPGALDQVGELARDWFLRHFIPRMQSA